MTLSGLIDDEVTIVECLNTEVVEVEVGCWVERFAEFFDIVFFKQLRMQAFDGHCVFEVGFEALFVRIFEFFNPIGRDVPVENFLVDVGEQDTGCELREVGIFFDEGLGVEDDG